MTAESTATDAGRAKTTSRSTPVEVRPRASQVALAIVMTWLVPGTGHWMLGRRGKAVLYFVGITFLFVTGLILGEFRNFQLEHFWLHFLAEVFYGGLAVPLVLLLKDLPLEMDVPADQVVMGFSTLDLGVLYTAVAGLLNICVMVDVFETAYPRPEPSDEAAKEGAKG